MAELEIPTNENTIFHIDQNLQGRAYACERLKIEIETSWLSSNIFFDVTCFTYQLAQIEAQDLSEIRRLHLIF